MKVTVRPARSVVWIIEDDQRRGRLEMVVLMNQKGSYGIIENVFVKKEHRKLGIATNLIEAAKSLAAEKKFYKIVLTCSEFLVPFYRKLGFEWQEEGQAYCMRLDFSYIKDKK